MAKFEGVKWAPRQMRYLLPDKQFSIVDSDSRVFAVSRSTFYAAFLCFEELLCVRGDAQFDRLEPSKQQRSVALVEVAAGDA